MLPGGGGGVGALGGGSGVGDSLNLKNVNNERSIKVEIYVEVHAW